MEPFKSCLRGDEVGHFVDGHIDQETKEWIRHDADTIEHLKTLLSDSRRESVDLNGIITTASKKWLTVAQTLEEYRVATGEDDEGLDRLALRGKLNIANERVEILTAECSGLRRVITPLQSYLFHEFNRLVYAENDGHSPDPVTFVIDRLDESKRRLTLLEDYTWGDVTEIEVPERYTTEE